MRLLIAAAGVVIVRLLHATLRVRHVRAHHIEDTPQYIIAFWHAHIPLMLHSRFRRPITVLSSQSKDGDISAAAFGFFRVNVVRGSSTRGGTTATRQLIRLARDGSNLVFTPDGPKGPPRVVKDGVIYLAKMSGLPIIPIAFSAARRHVLGSTWDRMAFPYPFSRAVFLYGEPIVVARDADVETARRAVERAMNVLADEVEQNVEQLWREEGTRPPVAT